MMKMVYTSENQFLVNNAKNLIEAQGIGTFLKNEFAQGAVGETSAFDAWPEVWVFSDADYEQALNIIETSLSRDNAVEWLCKNCHEKNDPSFEVCWNCQYSNV
ncbi:MAG: putative signal transducing protein [Pseudomonadales bacterium]